ncbi:hypothetical protein ABK040_004399 [Willaertia magna]
MSSTSPISEKQQRKSLEILDVNNNIELKDNNSVKRDTSPIIINNNQTTTDSNHNNNTTTAVILDDFQQHNDEQEEEEVIAIDSNNYRPIPSALTLPSVPSDLDIAGKLSNISQSSSSQSLNNYSASKPWDSLLFENQCVFEWKEITYGGNPKSISRKYLLYKLCGFAVPGKITAIVGTTGSGKSLLLKLLSRQFNQIQKYEGEILVNGLTLKKTRHRSVVSLVERLDQFFVDASLTVREYLTFAARFKFNPERTKDQPYWLSRRERIEQLIERFGLKEKENSLISSLSAGEKKLLSITYQSILPHRVILFDEPISELDFEEAYHIFKVLKRLAKRGISIIVTIQQPTMRILQKIDFLQILNKGRLCYAGRPEDLRNYWEKIGYPIPNDWNACEYCISVLRKHNHEKRKVLMQFTFDEDLEDIQHEHKLNDLSIMSHHSDQSDDNLDFFSNEFNKQKDKYLELKNFEMKRFENLIGKPLLKLQRFHVNYFVGIFILLYRSYKIKFRNYKTSILGPLFEKLVFGVLPGIFLFQLGTAANVLTTRTRVFFFMNINLSLTFSNSIKALAGTIPQTLFERRKRSYPIGCFYIAKSIEDLLEFVIWPTLFAIILFWLVGLNSNDIGRFFVFILINCAANLCCMSFAQMLIFIIPRQNIVGVIAPVINVAFTFLSSIYCPLEITPNWLVWTYYLSYFFYFYRAITINEYWGETFTHSTPTNNSTVNASSLTPFLKYVDKKVISTFYEPFNILTNNGNNNNTMSDGNKYLRDSGITESYEMVWVYIGALLGYFVFYKIVGYLGIRFIYKRA